MCRGLLLAFFVALVACSADGERLAAPEEDACVETVAAFDIGSATTKMQVAVVNTCKRAIEKRLARGSRPTPYGDDVAALGAVSEATLEKGRQALTALAAEADRYHPEHRIAVATEALRKARNGAKVIDTLHAVPRMSVRVITQHEEAQLGFWGAVSATDSDPSHALSWDVGGESMQFAAWTGHEVVVHGVTFASGDMRRVLLTEIQRKSADATPNPVTEAEANLARAHAARHALGRQPVWLQRRLERPGTVVIGLGALRYYGDHGGFPDECSHGGLQALLAESVGKTDTEIGGDYARGRVPDIALFLGVMDTLGIDAVQIANADLTDGLIVLAARRNGLRAAAAPGTP